MQPGTSSEDPSNEPHSVITSESMDVIGNSLTVLRGRIQLLRRKLNREGVVDADELSRVLVLLDHASRSVSDRLDRIAAQRPRRAGDSPSAGEDGENERPFPQ